MNDDLIRGVVKTILAVLGLGVAIKDRSEYIRDVLTSEELKDLTNSQRWDIQEQIREELRKQAMSEVR